MQERHSILRHTYIPCLVMCYTNETQEQSVNYRMFTVLLHNQDHTLDSVL